jgi:NADH:ubiquinone oxidoreductase subunit 6 (subunit J)
MDFNTFLFWLLASLTGLCALAVVVSQNIVRTATWLLFTLAGTSGIFFLLGADFVGATQLFVYVGGTLVLVVFGVMLTAQGPFISMKTGAAEWAVALVVGLMLFAMLTITAVSFRTDPQEVKHQIEQLGSSKTEEWRSAEQRLQALGRVAYADLQEAAAHHTNADVRKRARDLLAKLDQDVKDYVKRLGSPKVEEWRTAAEHLQALGELARPDLQVAAQNDANIDLRDRAKDVLAILDRNMAPDRSMSSVVLGEALLGMEEATPKGTLTGTPTPLPRYRTQVAYLLPFEIVSIHLLVVLIGAAYLARAKKRRQREVPHGP